MSTARAWAAAPLGARGRQDAWPSASSTRASTTCKLAQRRHPARQVHASSRACRARASRTLAFDILFNEGQRRYLESERLRAQHRAARGPAGGGRGVWHPAHGGDRAAAEPRWPQEHGGHHHRGPWHFLRLLYVKLGLQHCVHDGNAAVKPQSTESIAAQPPARQQGPARGPAGAAGGQPQGPLHRSGQMGQGPRPHASARGWRVHRPWRRGRDWTASRNTHSSCRWATWWSRRNNEADLRELLARGAGPLGKGVLRWC